MHLSWLTTKSNSKNPIKNYKSFKYSMKEKYLIEAKLKILSFIRN